MPKTPEPGSQEAQERHQLGHQVAANQPELQDKRPSFSGDSACVENITEEETKAEN